MKNHTHKHFTEWAQYMVLLIFLFFSISAGALQSDFEGEDWIKWNLETRNAFIFAYVSGLNKGYGAGCHNGVLAVPPPRSGKKDLEAIGKCWNDYPLIKSDPIQYVPLITKFYESYPSQRYLDIWKILYEAAKGWSVATIHEHFLHSSYP